MVRPEDEPRSIRLRERERLRNVRRLSWKFCTDAGPAAVLTVQITRLDAGTGEMGKWIRMRIKIKETWNWYFSGGEINSQRTQRLSGKNQPYRRGAENAEIRPRRSAALQRVEVYFEDGSFGIDDPKSEIYHSRIALAQVRPPPKATSRTLSPFFSFISGPASCRATGMQAADMLP